MRLNRGVIFVVSVVLLAVLLVGTGGAREVLIVAAVGGMGWLGFVAVSALLRKVRRSAHRLKSVEVEVLPPPERYRGRSPTTLERISAALRESRFGEVRSEERRCILVTPDEDVFQVDVEDAARVTYASVRVRCTSANLALVGLDVLAPALGPITARIGGVELLIDGILPRVDLERRFHEEHRLLLRRLETELEGPPAAAPEPKRYLN